MISGTLGSLRVGDAHNSIVMGVINLTSNSFFPGSIKMTENEIIDAATTMEKNGANIIDIGARSTAPYRKSEISEATESKLLRKAVKLIASKVTVPISADTTRMSAARAAVEEGASILNDVYGLTQKDRENLARLVYSKDLSLILTAHERHPMRNHDPIARVSSALKDSLAFAAKMGINEDVITIDPGIGFFSDSEISNVRWNCTVLRQLKELRTFKRPICVGVSRKRFIGTVTGGKDTSDRLFGSIAASAIATYNGAHVIRAHDVRETVDAVRIATAVKQKGLSA